MTLIITFYFLLYDQILFVQKLQLKYCGLYCGAKTYVVPTYVVL